VTPSLPGGIGELIHEATGWPVCNPYDAREYAERLREALEAPAAAVVRADALASLIAQRHSFQTFCRSVSELVTACQGSVAEHPSGHLARANPRPAYCAAPASSIPA
jgi:glycosyltransferase involved in cell wall biosynthesis